MHTGDLVGDAIADARKAAAHYRKQRFGEVAKAWEQFNVALDRLVATVAAAERERCARVADHGDTDYRPAARNPGSAGDYWLGKADAYRDCAAAIRATPPEDGG